MAAALACIALDGPGAEPAALHKKEIPAITLNNLSPPYKDYSYFHNCAFVPFEPKAASFSLVNAWWLAEASTLVYADEAFARQRFAAAGFNRVIYFNRSSTQCFIAGNSRFAVVAFRGSEIWKRNERFDPGQILADLKTNIDIRLTDWRRRGGKVHKGFKTALDSVWGELLPEIRWFQDRGVPIWVTGHSLGGALAALAADGLPEVQGVYTYGSPRVGNQEFQSRFGPKAFRVVNGSDIVADVPPEGPYRHVGEHVWIDPAGNIHLGPGAIGESGQGARTGSPHRSTGKEGVGQPDSAPYIPSSIRDHVPLLYSIYLWNQLVGHETSCAGQ